MAADAPVMGVVGRAGETEDPGSSLASQPKKENVWFSGSLSLVNKVQSNRGRYTLSSGSLCMHAYSHGHLHIHAHTTHTCTHTHTHTHIYI